MVVLLVSFEEKSHAEKAAHFLVDKKLAACVSIFPVTSFYYWKGKKMNPGEYEAFIKTTEKNVAKIESAIKELVSYEIPQIITLNVTRVNKSYLNWLNEQVDSSPSVQNDTGDPRTSV